MHGRLLAAAVAALLPLALPATASAAGVLTIAPLSQTVSEGAGSVGLTVERSGDTDGTSTVQWATHDGSATAGQDFTAAGGTLTFEPGQTSKAISVPLIDDAAAELLEAFTVQLSNPGGTGALGAQTTASVLLTSQEQLFFVDDPDDAGDAAPDGLCDAGPADGCTLRAAIQEANGDAVSDRDAILLLVNPALTAALPDIVEPLQITDDGAGARAVIDGNGQAGLHALADLDLFDADLTGFSGYAVEVAGADLLLQDADVTDSGGGVRLGAGAGGLVGGSTGTVTRIFGHTGHGVELAGSSGAGVANARIGLDGPNGGDGVVVGDASAQVFGNTISRNAGAGLRMQACADAQVISGNRIGTLADGTGSAPNGTGVVLAASNCAVGGGSAPNVIAGNAGHGVLVTGAAALLAGNQIRANGLDGVATSGGGGARITRSSIDGNGGLGIDRGDDGVTAQGTLASPAVTRQNGQLRVTGMLAGGGYILELFANPACDPSGYGEGAALLGSVAVAVTGGALAATVPADAPAGTVVSATVTGQDGTTSEFSACTTVAEAPAGGGGGGGGGGPGGGGGGGTAADPESQITFPRGRVKARKVRRIRGTATDAARVKVAVIRRLGGGRCSALTRRGTFVRRTGPDRCSPARFFRATGSSTWRFRLARRFRPGVYVIYSRAIAADGTREAEPARVRVRLRR